MSDENVPIDHSEAALAMFTAPEGDTAPPTEKPAEGQQAAEGQQQVEGQQEGQQEQQPTEGQLTDEQRQADPAYQQLNDFKDQVTNALAESGIPLDKDGSPDLNEAKLQLSDASVLYQIMKGEAPPSRLLDTMAANSGWSAEQKQGIAKDLIGWLTKSGYLKGDAAAGGQQQQQPATDATTRRLEALENERKTEKQQQQERQQQEHQQKVFTSFTTKLAEIATQKGIDKADHNFYIDKVAEQIKGNPAVIARIQAGNFVDVQRFFAQVYNAEVARMARYNKQQTAAAEKKANSNPRIPAGGAPPNPAGQQRPKPRTYEERTAAALEQFKS